MEGNTDALMAHQEGFENVVGTLGTALTAGQVELVTRYAPRIALAYDVDTAGQDAATFGATELTALVAEIERSPYHDRFTDVDVVRLPEGKDPDEVIRDEPETWRAATEKPQAIMEFLIDRAATRHDPRTIAGREKLVNTVMPTLRAIGDPVRRDGYLQLLSRRSGVDERVLLETLHRPVAVRRRSPRVRPGRVADQPGGRPGESGRARSRSRWRRTWSPRRRRSCACCCSGRSWWRASATGSSSDLLTSTIARELWRALESTPRTTAFDRAAFLTGLDPTLADVARTLYARNDPLPEGPTELEQAVDQSLLTLERNRIDEVVEFKRAELAEAEARQDRETAARILAEVRDLEARRADFDLRKNNASLLSLKRISDSRTATPAGGPA